MRRTVVVPHSSPPSETTRWTLMGLIGSGLRLWAVTWSKPPAEHRVSRIARPDVLLSLVRAPALLPQHADFGSQFHTPSNRCLRFGPRVAATPARLAPVLPARLWTDQTFTGKLIPAFLSHPASGSRTKLHAFTHGTSCPSRHRRTSPKYLFGFASPPQDHEVVRVGHAARA